MVAYMLTPDDGSTNGKFISYLEQPHKWSRYGPILFERIRDVLKYEQKRRVSLIEDSGLLPKADYFSPQVPDSTSDRSGWFTSLFEQAQESELIFLDPDDGLEVKSKFYGREDSRKFVYWREIEALWSSGKSLLIYQHFIRENRINFIQRMLQALRDATPDSFVRRSQRLMLFSSWHYSRNIGTCTQSS